MTDYIVDGNFILDGIVRKLVEKFPTIRVYDERSNQITKPCFFVHQIRTKQNKQLRERYHRLYTVVVRYHPLSSDVSEYCNLNTIENQLYEHLTTITCGYQEVEEGEEEIPGVLVRGIDTESRVVENVLHFLVTYVTEIKKPEDPVAKMAELTTNIEVELEE